MPDLSHAIVAASRFDGPWPVQVGFLVVFAAFGYGLAVAWLAVARIAAPAAVSAEVAGDRRQPLVALALAAAVACLFLPAVQGISATSGRFEHQSAWKALDPLSTGLIASLSTVLAVLALRSRRRDRGSLLLAGSVCVAGLFAGNLLIQAYTPRPSDPDVGLGAGLAASMASVALAAARAGRRRRIGVRGDDGARL